MKKLTICVASILLMHIVHATKITPQKFVETLEKKQPEYRKPLEKHLKKLGIYPSQKPKSEYVRGQLLVEWAQKTNNSETTPVAVPLMICASAIVKEGMVDESSKKEANKLFQKILRNANEKGITDIYSLDLAE